MKEIKLSDILLVVVVLVLIAIFFWRIFGESPTLDQLSMGLSILFLVLAFESRLDSKALKRLNFAMVNKLDDIKIMLSRINRKI